VPEATIPAVPEAAIPAAPEAASPADLSQVVPTRSRLFLTFFKIGVCGFGGVGPWARRVIVEEAGWLDDREYAEMLTMCQVLPGPNVGNVSIFLGDRYHGGLGSALAISGLMLGPLTIILGLALLYDQFGGIPFIDHAIGGVAAAAAGLFLGTALKMIEKLRLSLLGLAILGCAFLAVGLLRWSLFTVMLALAPVSVLAAWRLRW
jgi:chromate transporter